MFYLSMKWEKVETATGKCLTLDQLAWVATIKTNSRISTNYNLQPENKMKIPLSQQALDNGNSKGQFELFNDESLESRIGLRIYSRLVETSNLVELTGNDYRQMLFQDRQNNRL